MKTLFATFDIFPSTKGASTHIAHTLEALCSVNGPVTLACLGHSDMPQFQEEQGITIRRCKALHPNFLKRTELYTEFVAQLLRRFGDEVGQIHFRDIWSGLALLEMSLPDETRIVYEVNGVPSIELPCHYPVVARNPGLLKRIEDIETACFERADRIMTVSQVNARYLRNRGVPVQKIVVLPNTVDMECFQGTEQRDTETDKLLETAPFILYAGTLAPWQGIETLLRAFRFLADRPETFLVLACSSRKHLRFVRKLIRKLAIEDRTKILIEVPRERLFGLYRKARLTVAPLARCDRNEVQGCSPLKIVESMALGTPVCASDLAVCREYIDHGKDGWLVSPDSARALAAALEYLLDNPSLRRRLGDRASYKVKQSFAKDIWMHKFQQFYQSLPSKRGLAKIN